MFSKDVKMRLGVVTLVFALSSSLIAQSDVVCEGGKCMATNISQNDASKAGDVEVSKFNTHKKIASFSSEEESAKNGFIVGLDDNEPLATNVVTSDMEMAIGDNTTAVEEEVQDSMLMAEASSVGTINGMVEEESVVSVVEENEQQDDIKILYQPDTLNEGEIYACDENKLLVCDTVDKDCKCV